MMEASRVRTKSAPVRNASVVSTGAMMSSMRAKDLAEPSKAHEVSTTVQRSHAAV